MYRQINSDSCFFSSASANHKKQNPKISNRQSAVSYRQTSQSLLSLLPHSPWGFMGIFTGWLSCSIKTSGLIRCYCKTLFKDTWQALWMGRHWGSFYRLPVPCQPGPGWLVYFVFTLTHLRAGMNMDWIAFPVPEACNGTHWTIFLCSHGYWRPPQI